MSILDAGTLGALIRKERKDQGVSSVSDFADAIFYLTGVDIPSPTLRRIEAGEQEPTLTQACIICMALFRNVPKMQKNADSLDILYTSFPVWLQNRARDLEPEMSLRGASAHGIDKRLQYEGEGIEPIRG